MHIDATRELVARLLADIAPEAELTAVGDDEDVRSALDLDSMDFLNLVVGLHEATGADIPETDYPRLFTLIGMADYLP
ncbi:MAG: phosphopantetheine-binding protein [Gammaproteobacteria bacterium]